MLPPSPKCHKIDPEQTYPCPCARRRGKLQPITLTDAFGCDRCSALFTTEDDGFTLVQLGGIDPYRQMWHWTGNRWQATYRGSAKYETAILPWHISLTLVAGMLIVLLLLSADSAFAMPLALLIAISLLLILLWLLILRQRS